MKIQRRVHRIQRLDGSAPFESHEYVRWHVVDDDGRCVPEACVGTGALCGYSRQYQARNAAVAYRDELRAAAGRAR